MNALQASERLQNLHARNSALARVIHYLGDEREWEEDIDELRDIQKHVEHEIRHLTEKLSAVKL